MTVLDKPILRHDVGMVDLEIRSDGTGRTIHGIVVPFGVRATVNDGMGPYDEMFRHGAFAKTLRERREPVKLLSQHVHAQPIGRAEEIREDASGLYGAFRVSNTAHGNDQLELVKDGVLTAFSVGFAPVKHVREADVTVRTEVGLRETSLVTFPAYEGAVVAGVRSLTPEEVHEALVRWEPDARAELIRILSATLSEPADLGTSGVEAAAVEPPDGHSTRYTPAEIRTIIRDHIARRKQA